MIFGKSFVFGATTLHVIQMPLLSLVFRVSFFWYPSLCFSGVYCIREIYPYKKGGDVTTLSLRSVFNLVIGSLINLRVYMKKEFLLL